MLAESPADNATVIESEIAWFRAILEQRLRLHGDEKGGTEPLARIPQPALPKAGAPYADVVQKFAMGAAERLVLMLAYVPHVRPEVLDPFLIQNQSVQRRFAEFGGFIGQAHAGFLPTGETAMFLLAGSPHEIGRAHV